MCFLSVLNASVAAADFNQHTLHHRQRILPRSPALEKSDHHQQQQQQQQGEQQNEVADIILQQILKLEQPHPFHNEVTSSSSSLLDHACTLHHEHEDEVKLNTLNVDELVNEFNHPTPLAAAAVASLDELLSDSPSSSSSSSSVQQAALELHDECISQRDKNIHNESSSSAAACLTPLVEEEVEIPSASPTSTHADHHHHHHHHELLVVSSPPPATNTAPDDPPTSATPNSTAPSSLDGGKYEYVAPSPHTQRRSKSAEHASATPPRLHDEVCDTPPPRNVGTPPPTSPCSSPSYRCTANRRSASSSSASLLSSSSIPLVVLRALQSSRSRRENAKLHTPIRIRSTTSSPPSSLSPSSPSFEASYIQHCAALPIAALHLSASSSSSSSNSDGAVYIEHETDDDEDDAACDAGQCVDGDGEFEELSAMFEAQRRMDEELKRQKQERRRIDSWKRDVRRNWNFDIIC